MGEPKWIVSLAAAASLALVGCGDDDGMAAPDAGALDAGALDAAAGDAGLCPDEEELWGDIDLSQFTALPALEVLGAEGTFTPAEPATYWELRRGRPDGNFEVVFGVGEKCGQATDAEVCRNEFDDMTAASGFGGSCPPGQCFGYIAVNREDTSSLVVTREELSTFLGIIDSPSEAALIAFAHGHYWDASDASAGSARVSEQGYELLVTELVADCDPILTDRVQARVSPAGALTVVRRQLYRVSCGACI